MSGKNFAGNLRITPVNKLGVAIAATIGLLNTVKCELVTPAPENIDQISRQKDSNGQLLSRAQIPKATSLNIAIDDTDDQRILALALNGIAVAYSQAAANVIHQSGATVTHEAVSAGVLGSVVALANKSVSSVVVTDAATDGTTYVLNTDYTVDALNGTITAKVGGAITAAEALHVSYVAAALNDEDATAPATLGDSIPLAHRHVSNVTVKNSARSTTYVAGTDYLADGIPGFIKILPGGAITAGQALKIGYQAAAITGTTVQGAKVTSTLLRIDVDLVSTVDGSGGFFVCPIFQASSSGNNDLFGKAMLVAAMSGAMFIPPVGSAASAETGGASFILTSVDG